MAYSRALICYLGAGIIKIGLALEGASLFVVLLKKLLNSRIMRLYSISLGSVVE